MNTISDLSDMDNQTLEKFIKLVYVQTGITMTFAKKALLQGRIRPRINKLGLSDYNNYFDLLRNNKIEMQEFINLVTTHETSFFRTLRVWDYFYKDFIPNWIINNPDKILKIWSAASSTGEEVYTIGICCEEIRSLNSNFNYSILGSDISSGVVKTAIKGEYSGRSIENFKNKYSSLFEKYMEPFEGKFKVSSKVKSKIRFETHNLFHKHSSSNGFDIIFLRNVLIYFDQIDQVNVISNLDKALVNKGILIIGESESLSGLSTKFDFVAPLIYMNQDKISE